MDFGKQAWEVLTSFFQMAEVDWRIRWAIVSSCLAYILVYTGLKEEGSRNALVRWVRRGTFAARYQSFLLWLLKATDRVFLTAREYEALPAQSSRRAFTFHQFNIAMAVAFLYPSISYLLAQAIGFDSQIGFRYINTEFDLSDRTRSNADFYGYCWIIMVPTTMLIIGKIRFSTHRICLLLSLTIMAITFYPWPSTTSMFYARDSYFLTTTSFIFASSLAYSLFRLNSYTSLFLAVGSISVLLLGPLRAAFGFQRYEFDSSAAGARSIWAHLTSPYPSNWVGADIPLYELILDQHIWIFSVTTVVIFAAASLKLIVTLIKMSVQAYWIAMSLTVLLLVLLVTAGYGSPDFLLVGCVLPFVNAIFDFFSIGFTRYFLRRGVRKIGLSTLFWGFADMFFGAILMVLLLGTSIVIIQFLNILSPDQVFAFEGYGFVNDERQFEEEIDETIFASIRNYPSTHAWLYVTFFSTILPTALHVSFSVFALGPTIMTLKARNVLANWFEKSSDNYYYRLLSAAVASSWLSISLLTPVVLLSAFFGVLSSSGTLGELLDLFENLYFLLPEDPSRLIVEDSD